MQALLILIVYLCAGACACLVRFKLSRHSYFDKCAMTAAIVVAWPAFIVGWLLYATVYGSLPPKVTDKEYGQSKRLHTKGHDGPCDATHATWAAVAVVGVALSAMTAFFAMYGPDPQRSASEVSVVAPAPVDVPAPVDAPSPVTEHATGADRLAVCTTRTPQVTYMCVNGALYLSTGDFLAPLMLNTGDITPCACDGQYVYVDNVYVTARGAQTGP